MVNYKPLTFVLSQSVLLLHTALCWLRFTTTRAALLSSSSLSPPQSHSYVLSSSGTADIIGREVSGEAGEAECMYVASCVLKEDGAQRQTTRHSLSGRRPLIVVCRCAPSSFKTQHTYIQPHAHDISQSPTKQHAQSKQTADSRQQTAVAINSASPHNEKRGCCCCVKR